MNNHKFAYNWNLKDTIFTKDKGTVFSCFACGGGSSMGYKLAGFDVIGCNEIDKKMMDCYIENLHPKYTFLEPIQTFKNRTDLPDELYNLDILDGSPPCSSFSMAGNREKDWGKMKKFKEGQALQVLDTLFFDFIDLAKKLQPKVVIAENVQGILFAAAKKYVFEIYKQFKDAGYNVKHFVLDASKMGVPQKRIRVFFIAIRNDLIEKLEPENETILCNFPKLDLRFNEKGIKFKEINEGSEVKREKIRSISYEKYYNQIPHNSKMNYCAKTKETGNKYGYIKKCLPHNIVETILSSNGTVYAHPYIFKRLTQNEFCKIGSFPLDYNFLNIDCQNIIGMSVPPVMTAQIATRIYEQWIKYL